MVFGAGWSVFGAFLITGVIGPGGGVGPLIVFIIGVIYLGGSILVFFAFIIVPALGEGERIEGIVSERIIREETLAGPDGEGKNLVYEIRVEPDRPDRARHIRCGRVFMISKRIHDWLYEGDKVAVIFWPTPDRVFRVDKLSEEQRLRGSALAFTTPPLLEVGEGSIVADMPPEVQSPPA